MSQPPPSSKEHIKAWRSPHHGSAHAHRQSTQPIFFSGRKPAVRAVAVAHPRVHCAQGTTGSGRTCRSPPGNATTNRRRKYPRPTDAKGFVGRRQARPRRKPEPRHRRKDTCNLHILATLSRFGHLRPTPHDCDHRRQLYWLRPDAIMTPQISPDSPPPPWPAPPSGAPLPFPRNAILANVVV